jgi:hypothetical protein
MATPALVAAPYGNCNSNLRRQCTYLASVSIGASGAPTKNYGPEGFDLTRDDVGDYSGTVPVGNKGAIFVQVECPIASSVGQRVVIDNLNVSAGTFDLHNHGNDLTTDPEEIVSGTTLHFLIVVEGG